MSNIKDTLSKIEVIFEKTEECLNEWTGTGNLQLPALVLLVSSKMGWNEKQVRLYDPVVRLYVKEHSNWYVTRGAHGGIMPFSEKQRKDALKQQKEIAKQQVKDAIDAKLAAAKPKDTNDSDSSDDLDDSDDSE